MKFIEEESEIIEEESENIHYSEENDEEGFLDELGRDTYISKPTLTEKELQRQGKDEARSMKKFILEQERDNKRHQRETKRLQIAELLTQKRNTKKANKMNNNQDNDDNDSLFGGDATPLLGKDKIVLLKKVKQYRSSFPTELAKFKIKKNPNVQELTDALSEMEILVETNSVDGFLMDSVIQCIKLIENVSSVSKNYDIRGCADLSKSNKQFHNLSEQLFIKYNVFSSVPAEYQLILLVSTTAYICTNKNKAKGDINDYLNMTI